MSNSAAYSFILSQLEPLTGHAVTGCVRSYLIKPGQPGYGTPLATTTYVYDQAACLLAALAQRDAANAQLLAGGLRQLQAPGGGFMFSAPQADPASGDPANVVTGASAIAAYSLLKYMAAFPQDGSRDYSAAADSALAYFGSVLVTSGAAAGLYRGGNGVTWVSSEHQFDLWHLFALAATVLGQPNYGTTADVIANQVISLLWDSAHSRFYQGYDPGFDTADPLDCHSWAALFCHGIGRDDLSGRIMASGALAPFRVTSGANAGYAPQYSAGGYPGATPTIWPEGSFGVALAFLTLGNTSAWQATTDGIAGLQNASGSYPYVSAQDKKYGLSPCAEVIGGAWGILSSQLGLVWNEKRP